MPPCPRSGKTPLFEVHPDAIGRSSGRATAGLGAIGRFPLRASRRQMGIAHELVEPRQELCVAADDELGLVHGGLDLLGRRVLVQRGENPIEPLAILLSKTVLWCWGERLAS